jgi:hypothetical protein
MRKILVSLVVLVALATAAGSASAAMPFGQKLQLWRHVCLASDGRVGSSGGPTPNVLDCGHFFTPAWSAATITRFEQVCLGALGGTSFLYLGAVPGFPFAEGVSCYLV